MSKSDPNLHPIGPVTVPHRPLEQYYRDEAERQAYVRRIFDDTAADYDRIERLLSFGSGSGYRRRALARGGVRAGASVLDVGCGTGLLAREALSLIGSGGRLVGVDPSPGMLARAALPGVQLLEGRAESLPCESAAFDFVTMGYALRHIGDLGAAFREFHRVLKPGGSVVVLELVRPERPLAAALLKGYMRGVVPLLARLVGKGRATPELWRYYWDTIEACVPPQRVLDTLLDAGFEQVRRQGELGLFVEFVGRRPGTEAGSGVNPNGTSTGTSRSR